MSNVISIRSHMRRKPATHSPSVHDDLRLGIAFRQMEAEIDAILSEALRHAFKEDPAFGVRTQETY